MPALVVPSYTRKLSWAEQHVQRLADHIQRFGDRHPYRAKKATEGPNRGRWVFEFTEPAAPEWSLMVGDVLYNLRATLDYLAGDLNPGSMRSHVMFPIVKESIWDIPPTDGENRERNDVRHKWDVSTRRMRPEAVAIIKRLQPFGDALLDSGYFHCLDLLNRLSNKDRHRTLHVHLSGLVAPIETQFFYDDGYVYRTDSEPDVPANLPGTGALQNGTTITPPPELALDQIVDVQIRGTVTQAIHMDGDERHVVIPDALRQILDWIRNEAVAPLSPYLYDLGT